MLRPWKGGRTVAYHLAVDIGASSGRHILGWLEGGLLRTREVYRFENKTERKRGAPLLGPGGPGPRGDPGACPVPGAGAGPGDGGGRHLGGGLRPAGREGTDSGGHGGLPGQPHPGHGPAGGKTGLPPRSCTAGRGYRSRSSTPSTSCWR